MIHLNINKKKSKHIHRWLCGACIQHNMYKQHNMPNKRERERCERQFTTKDTANACKIKWIASDNFHNRIYCYILCIRHGKSSLSLKVERVVNQLFTIENIYFLSMSNKYLHFCMDAIFDGRLQVHLIFYAIRRIHTKSNGVQYKYSIPNFIQSTKIQNSKKNIQNKNWWNAKGTQNQLNNIARSHHSS